MICYWRRSLEVCHDIGLLYMFVSLAKQSHIWKTLLCLSLTFSLLCTNVLHLHCLWTLAVHQSLRGRRADSGAFRGLRSSHRAFGSECKRPHNPQTNPWVLWASSPEQLIPLQTLPGAPFWKAEIVCDSRIMEIFFKCCVSSSSPRRSTDCFSFMSSSVATLGNYFTLLLLLNVSTSNELMGWERISSLNNSLIFGHFL